MMIVRHPSRTDDAKFHIVEDGITAAKFDTLAELHQWAANTVADSLETAASYRSEAEQAENFAASLAEMMAAYPSRNESDEAPWDAVLGRYDDGRRSQYD